MRQMAYCIKKYTISDIDYKKKEVFIKNKC